MTMLIDHAALTLVYAKLAKYPEYLNLIFSGEATQEQIAALPADYVSLHSAYIIMRMVGRIAFPLFAFLLFEGFMHTSDYTTFCPGRMLPISASLTETHICIWLKSLAMRKMLDALMLETTVCPMLTRRSMMMPSTGEVMTQ